MKIIIEASGIKRELRGPYRICLGADDLEILKRRICGAQENGFHYGWIFIHQEADDGEPNTSVIPWENV